MSDATTSLLGNVCTSIMTAKAWSLISAVSNTYSSSDDIVGASVTTACWTLCSVPITHPSSHCEVGASFMAASFMSVLSTMLRTNSKPLGKVGTSVMVAYWPASTTSTMVYTGAAVSLGVICASINRTCPTSPLGRRSNFSLLLFCDAMLCRHPRRVLNYFNSRIKGEMGEGCHLRYHIMNNLIPVSMQSTQQ